MFPAVALTGVLLSTFTSSVLARQAPLKIPSNECCDLLADSLPGKVHWPGQSSYDAQQSSYYSGEQASLQPQCRVSPTSTFDVSRIMKIAASNKCRFSVRGGGHMSWSGSSNIDSSGFTIDMQGLRGVTLSDDRTVVSFASGSRWRDVYNELTPYNLTTVGGRVGDVGVGGFLLGGGIGFLSAEHGFGSDNVVNYEVVLADGTVINANNNEHHDLYWALKLGSTNFGIVTRFDMSTIPQGLVWGGSQFYSLKDAPALLEKLVVFTKKLGEEPKGFYGLSLAWNPAQQDYIIWTLQTYLEPVAYPPLWSDFVELKPLVDMMGIKTLSQITEEFQEADPGKQGRSQWLSMTYKANAQFHLDLHAKGIELFQSHHHRPGVHWAVSIQPVPRSLGAAAVSRGGNPSCLTSNDDELWIMLITTDWLDPSDDAPMKACSQALLHWAENEARKRGLFHPFIYMNYATGSQRVLERTTKQSTMERMQETQKRYDPNGILRKSWIGGFKLPLQEQERDVSEL
ncbi:hypothetical protein VNI00_012546 [Paramarasmius palmivorus]|uniref:FAD-binding PCMH-type domain-containing protein n=1 Tax=Paramarasmius palmivorus TaxID=297713 RepID=A0AAW0C4P1_9AGAR